MLDKEQFDYFTIKNVLKTKFIVKNIKFFEEIDSTNIYCKNKSKEFIEDGTIVIANYQTSGVGRQSKVWFTEKDKCIIFSLVLKPKEEIKNVMQLNIIISTAICRAIENISKLKPMIKWPNDIILNERKLGGILIETTYDLKSIKNIIIGVGININNDLFHEEIKNKATSLKIETNQQFNRIIILREILQQIEIYYENYIKSLDFNNLLKEYKSLCINIGKNVMLKYKTNYLDGIVLDIGESGELVFLSRSGEKIYINSGEVSLRNLNGDYI